MSQEKKHEDSSKNSDINNTQEQLDDPNTLHEQLKKIKEESSESGEGHTDIDNPIYEYCS